MMSVRIAAVVFNSPRGTARANLDRMEDWVAGARAHGAAIVCFPELNITGYGTDAGVKEEAEPVPGPLTERLGAMAARHGLVILAGLAEQAERRPDLREPPGRRTGRPPRPVPQTAHRPPRAAGVFSRRPRADFRGVRNPIRNSALL